ncbi:hypothetical protein GQR58_023669 [Nymphon striatum]|nr:hypothetical protein GQR58_023669 [Nymphon striatum]
MLSLKVKQRGGHRASTTKVVDEVEKACASENKTVVMLKGKKTILEIKLNVLAELDKDILDLMVESEPAEFEQEVSQADIYCTKILNTITHIDEVIDSLNPSTDLNASIDSVNSFNQNSGVKLPKLSIKPFNGDILQFQSFLDQFNAAISSSNLNNIEKFTYLKSLVEGPAANCVAGLPLTANNFEIAFDLLKNRFGKRSAQIQAHISHLLRIQPVLSENSWFLRKLLDSLEINVRGLEALDISGKTYSALLVPILLSRLPDSIKLQWAKIDNSEDSDVKDLLKFLQKEVESQEFVSRNTKDFGDKSISGKQFVKGKISTSQSLSNNSTQTCVFCGLSHAAYQCEKFLNSNRESMVKSHKLCFNCLKPGHCVKDCYSKFSCKTCAKRHHTTLHRQKFATESSTSSEPVNIESPMNNDPSLHSHTYTAPTSTIVLQTALVKVMGQTARPAQLLFDTASNRSYIQSSYAKAIDSQQKGVETLNNSVFGGDVIRSQRMRVIRIGLVDVTGTVHYINLLEIRKICSPIQKKRVNLELCPELKDIKLADTVQGGEMNIDILIGMDIYWELIKNRIISTSIGLIAIESIFGFVLSGHITDLNSSVCCSNIALLNIDDAQTMWDLETIGIKGKESEVENPCFENFKSNISFDGNRYSVSLLWKGDTSHLMNNEEQAFKRLIYLENRLDRNLKLKNTYNDAIKQMEQNDFIEEIDMCTPKNNSNVFYLPHHPVIKTSSFTTKVRPVFDASAKGPNGVSLNDCLHSGTSLIPDLVAVLIRFRRWTVALCGDIEKAFLQINLDKSERDFHRFLWKQNNKIRHMRFKRVTFGVKCSPFLLNAVVKFHLQNQTPSDAVHELHDNLYVDDLLTGANSVEEAIDLYQQTTEIIAKAGMNLRQWASNSPEIIKSIQQCRKGNVCELNNNQTKILGLVWDCETDSFSFIISELLKDIECLVVTKRLVLSSIAKIFDPLGFITPYTIAAKILFQDICKRGSDWDEELPVKYKNIWEQWLNELKDLQHVRFPRKLLKTENFKKLADQKSLQLHVFADASEKAYGCAVYLKYDTHVTLIMSRSRVSPIKTISLPRLELLAALLASRLIDYVKESLYLPSDCSSYYWSDSKIVLAWIQSSPSRWKTFVANRVTEIQERTNANSWLHCPGISNPADLLTRPQKSNKCLDPLWWTGPQWLSEDNSFWPTMPQLNIEYTQESEIRKSFDINLVTTVYPVPFMKIDNFSNYKKLLRVTAYVFRAISIMKKSKITGPITSSEYDQSEIFWLKQTQMEFYPDAYNQIKCNKPIQTPELLKLNPIWDLAARERFWIPSSRRLAKKIKSSCVVCSRYDKRSCNEICAPLPADRIIQSPPFCVTGVDHCGPFQLKGSRVKHYICLFSCATTRAIHLELADSLYTEEFIICFRKFISRRGIPQKMYSDNATNFVKASKDSFITSKRIQWNFIAPRAPWWGGFWERMVRVVKNTLRKTIGTAYLSKKKFVTLLSEVEFLINNRPLTYVDTDAENILPLTPSHFLLGRTSLNQINYNIEDISITADQLRARKTHYDNVLNNFWKRWQKEYLLSLPTCVDKLKKSGNLNIDKIVLIREDNVPRSKWSLGKIVEVYPGRDGRIRAVALKTAKGIIRRPIQRLHLLELSIE